MKQNINIQSFIEEDFKQSSTKKENKIWQLVKRIFGFFFYPIKKYFSIWYAIIAIILFSIYGIVEFIMDIINFLN